MCSGNGDFAYEKILDACFVVYSFSLIYDDYIACDFYLDLELYNWFIVVSLCLSVL